MDDAANVAGSKILTNVIGGVIIALLTLSVSNMDDRYRASEAERDLRQVRAEIALSEARTKELIAEHKTSGPHDDVAERITANETRYTIILDELKQIRTNLRDLANYGER